MRLACRIAFCLQFCAASAFAQTLPIPERPTNCLSGSQFIQRISSLDLANREREIYKQVIAGNVPKFYRKFCPVSVTNVTSDQTNWAIVYVAPDYLAVGSDEDYFLTPMTPYTAQRLADALGCALPTRRMVNAIYRVAAVKLEPSPLSPGPAMVTVPVFAEENLIVRTQRLAEVKIHPLGSLVAGDKKDVVISARLAGVTNRVAIYGWQRTNGTSIQPLYLGHSGTWVDYSQGIRLVQQKLIVNGESKSVVEVLADPNLCGLLSDEGVIANPRYPTNAPAATSSQLNEASKSAQRRTGPPTFAEFEPGGSFGELITSFTFKPEVKVQVNAPSRGDFAPAKPVLLIFYALPNGNTTEQTIGKRLKPSDDWHLNIQHIGAQTRWLRQVITNRTIVVAYLEAEMKSWPAWRKKYGDQSIPELLGLVERIFPTQRVEVVLTGHSGGGSLTFGYLNTIKQIPDEVVRIAFLDSDYAYDSTNHQMKFVNWLKSSAEHWLCVLAYQDYLGLLDGKPFVSEKGGTWGRSLAMLEDLLASFVFQRKDHDGLQNYSALGGRIQFFLKENPDHKILHTVQVERNGFIHAMLTGTPLENQGYEYLGPRAYEQWIQE